MKKLGCLLILWLFALSAEAQLTDDFSDGDFTNNPTWSGDVSQFQISTNNELQSNGPSATETLYLSTQNTAIDNIVWEFFLKMDFNPSSSNYAKVYLTSDQADLEGNLNGYFLYFGRNSDRIDLVRQDGSTESTLISSASSILSTNPVEVRVQVIRSNSGDWSLKADLAGGTNFADIGTANDNTHTSTTHFGVVCQHTTSRRELFFFDDFEIKNAPISLISASAESSNPSEIQVLFSDAVDVSTAQDVNNYNISGIGNPSSATVDGSNPALVRLALANPLTTGSFTVTINNVQDQAQVNTIDANSEASFTFTAPIEPYQLVISEIMADPTPAVGLPETEFIEIHNTTGSAINLLDVTFSDGSGSFNLPNYELPANGYLILCDDSDVSTLQTFGPTLGLTSFPALTNGGELLAIRDAFGSLVFEVNYDDAWYQDEVKEDGGYTLEIINPTDTCKLPENNWIASNDPSGGTPGRQNSVFDNTPDTEAPLISSVSTQSADRISLIFNEKMNLASVQNATYSISDGSNSISVSQINIISDNEFTLDLASSLILGRLYTFTVSGASDCPGNVIGSNSNTFGLSREPSFHELLITEIMADPTPEVGLPDAEYIEIYNPTSDFLKLDGVQLQDGTSITTLPNGEIRAGEYLILTSTSNAVEFSNFGTAIGVTSFPSLGNSGEQLALLSATGNVLFEITYDDDWYGEADKSDGGYSLEMIDTNFPCIEMANWSASNDVNGGTPGEENSFSSALSDNLPPSLVSVSGLNSDSLLITFDEKLDAGAVASASYSISPSINIEQVHFDLLNANQIVLETESMSLGTSYTVEISGLQDCAGNLLSSSATANFGIPETADSLDIILNEITPEAFSQGERFVEVYNNSAKFINLQGWQIGRVDEDGVVDDTQVLSISPLVIGPGEYYAFTGDKEVTQSDYPQGSEFFDRIIETSSDIPSFGYDENNQTVVLLNPTDVEMDRFVIKEAFQFDLLADSRGVSLERVDFDSPTNDGNNWKSAASTSGFGTPGYLNSQNIDNPKGSIGGDCFELTPEVFSPDNDGMDDFTTIHYTCNQNNLTATITIYDAFGRMVRRLVQNRTIGTQGFIQWDGTTDAGEKAKVGYYVVLIETFSIGGSSDKVKKTVAVGAKF